MEIFEALVCGRPWVGAVASQPAVLCGVGLADPFLRSNISGAETTRYSSGAFLFARDSLITSETFGDLTIEANAPLQLFINGLTDLGAIEGLWWTLTTGDTNLGKGGDPVDSGLGFLCCGMTAETPDPYQRLAFVKVPLSPSNKRYYNAFLRKSGPYAKQLKAAVLNNVAVQVQFGNLGITNRLGLLAQYPSWGGPNNGDNGSTNSPMVYQPFQAAMLIGPNNQMIKLQMTLSFGQGVSIANISAFPTSGQTSNGTDLFDGSVFQPVRVAMVGYIVCVPENLLCGVPASFPTQTSLKK